VEFDPQSCRMIAEATRWTLGNRTPVDPPDDPLVTIPPPLACFVQATSTTPAHTSPTFYPANVVNYDPATGGGTWVVIRSCYVAMTDGSVPDTSKILVSVAEAVWSDGKTVFMANPSTGNTLTIPIAGGASLPPLGNLSSGQIATFPYNEPDFNSGLPNFNTLSTTVGSIPALKPGFYQVSATVILTWSSSSALPMWASLAAFLPPIIGTDVFHLTGNPVWNVIRQDLFIPSGMPSYPNSPYGTLSAHISLSGVIGASSLNSPPYNITVQATAVVSGGQTFSFNWAGSIAAVYLGNSPGI
jgi:hypothetical protein